MLRQSDYRVHRAQAEKLAGQLRLDPIQIPIAPEGYLIFVQVGQPAQRDSIFASRGFPAEAAWLGGDVTEWDTLKVVTLAQPIAFSSSQVWFSLAHSNRELKTELATLRSYLIAANAVSIFIACVVVYFVSGYTLRPIHRIIHVANRINASKSIERVPVPASEDENRHLAMTINNMLARIEEGIRNQTNFFASAAHELRTPLSVMKAELSLNANKVSVAEHLKPEVERLDRVIDDFLLISELRADSLVLRNQECELDELIYQSIRKCRHLALQRSASVLVRLDDSKASIAKIDPDKMTVVFTNLLENAIIYSPAGSTLNIELRRVGGGIRLTVSNPTLQPVTDPGALTQEFKKSGELSSGLGLGLWITDQLVRRQGGTLRLEFADMRFQAVVTLPLNPNTENFSA